MESGDRLTLRVLGIDISERTVSRLLARGDSPPIRRECLDRSLFWTAADLEMKLLDFQRYYNGHRTHAGAERAHAGTEHGHRLCPPECQFASMAATLSRAVSDADGGVNEQPPNLGSC